MYPSYVGVAAREAREADDMEPESATSGGSMGQAPGAARKEPPLQLPQGAALLPPQGGSGRRRQREADSTIGDQALRSGGARHRRREDGESEVTAGPAAPRRCRDEEAGVNDVRKVPRVDEEARIIAKRGIKRPREAATGAHAGAVALTDAPREKATKERRRETTAAVASSSAPAAASTGGDGGIADADPECEADSFGSALEELVHRSADAAVAAATAVEDKGMWKAGEEKLDGKRKTVQPLESGKRQRGTMTSYTTTRGRQGGRGGGEGGAASSTSGDDIARAPGTASSGLQRRKPPGDVHDEHEDWRHEALPRHPMVDTGEVEEAMQSAERPERHPPRPYDGRRYTGVVADPVKALDARGHRLRITGPVIWCANCGRYASRRLRRALKQECAGSAIGAYATRLSRLKVGRHPITGDIIVEGSVKKVVG